MVWKQLLCWHRKSQTCHKAHFWHHNSKECWWESKLWEKDLGDTSTAVRESPYHKESMQVPTIIKPTTVLTFSNLLSSDEPRATFLQQKVSHIIPGGHQCNGFLINSEALIILNVVFLKAEKLIWHVPWKTNGLSANCNVLIRKNQQEHFSEVFNLILHLIKPSVKIFLIWWYKISSLFYTNISRHCRIFAKYRMPNGCL